MHCSTFVLLSILHMNNYIILFRNLQPHLSPNHLLACRVQQEVESNQGLKWPLQHPRVARQSLLLRAVDCPSQHINHQHFLKQRQVCVFVCIMFSF